MSKLDGRELKDKDRDKRITQMRRDAEAHARKIMEFRARAERISRDLEGREHSDSAELLREDRAR
jgi:hypothetical protein